MEVYPLYGDDETIRAFAAEVTRTENPLELLSQPKYYSIRTSKPSFINLMIEKLLKVLDRRNHISTREFNNQYFLVKDSSREFSFWLMTISKHSTFEQQSQRYVKLNSLENILDGEASNVYNQLIKMGAPKEDARYVLPLKTKTNFVMKTNLREIENIIHEFYSKDYPEEAYEFLEKVMDIVKRQYKISSRRLVKEMKKQRKKKKLVNINLKYESKYPKGNLLGYYIFNHSDLEKSLRMSEGWFEFEISHSAAHQLIRHREMTKTIEEFGNGYIIPPSIYKNEKARKLYENIIQKLFKKYEETKDVGYLPNAALVKIYSKEDLYTFIENVVSLRTCYAAQWEIRDAVTKIRNQLQKVLGYEIPLGRCRIYTSDSKLKELFPTQDCPEKMKDCPIYKKFFNK